MERIYIVLGVVAWSIALAVGFLMQTITVTQDVPEQFRIQAGRSVSAVTPNPVSGPLAAGFAIAGGLCFVAAGLAGRGTPPTKPLRTEQARRDAEASIAMLEGESRTP